MSLETMASRLTGYVTNLPKTEAYNCINDAWTDVRNNRLWSFQCVEDGVTSPSVISVGTFTTVQGQTTVTADATASAALTGIQFPIITQRQIRIQAYSIYSVIGFDNTNPAAVVLTLDRPVLEPSGAGQSYMLYQAYYPRPFKDFKRWISWRDMTNGYWLDIYATRKAADFGDPRRVYYSFPYWVLPFQTDTRANSSTAGYMLDELYPNPLSVFVYMRWGVRTGADLIDPGDELPEPITDKLVLEGARKYAYRWAEGNKSPDMPRGAGADYKFLTLAANAEYEKELKVIGKKDRDRVDLFLTRIPKVVANKYPYFSSLIGRAYGGG